MSLNTQCHNGVDDIVVVLLQGLDGLLPADVGLGHDKLDILVLNALGVDLLAVILLLLLLGIGVGGLAGLGVAVARVVVLTTGSGELLGGSLLGSGVEVLDLGLAEDAAVAG